MFLALNNTPRFKHSKLVYLQAAESWSCTLAHNWAIIQQVVKAIIWQGNAQSEQSSKLKKVNIFYTFRQTDSCASIRTISTICINITVGEEMAQLGGEVA